MRAHTGTGSELIFSLMSMPFSVITPAATMIMQPTAMMSSAAGAYAVPPRPASIERSREGLKLVKHFFSTTPACAILSERSNIQVKLTITKVRIMVNA